MSQISILCFTAINSSSPSSIHWSILLSPSQSTEPERQKQKFTSRFLRRSAKSEPEPASSPLFDMHNHQLRQQPFSVPVTAESDSESDTPSPTSTTTNIESSIPNKYLSLILKIKLSTQPLSTRQTRPQTRHPTIPDTHIRSSGRLATCGARYARRRWNS